MKNKDINRSLSNAIQEAPIDLLEQIKSQPIRKMEEHDFFTSQEPIKPKSNYWRPLISVASALGILMIAYLGWFTQFRVVDSIVYFDINPSVEISTNKQDEVISLKGLNEEGQELVKDMQYKGKDVYSVTLELIDSLLERGTIDVHHHAMLVSVLNENQEKSQKQVSELNEMIHNYFREHHVEPIVLRQSIIKTNTLEQFAEQYNISLGKMNFIKNLILLNPEFKLEELVDLSLKDLIKLSQENGLDLKRILDVDEDLKQFNDFHESDDDDIDDGDDDYYDDDDDDDDDGDDGNDDDDDDYYD